SNLAARRAAHGLGIPFMSIENTVAASFADSVTPHREELAQQYSRARAVISVSRNNLNLLHQRFGLPRHKGEVILYGRPASYFPPPDAHNRSRLRQEQGIPDDGVVCFTAARLDVNKGYQYQIDAIRRLRSTPAWPKLWFVWAGGGPLHQQLV